ncbi:hypothetical protein GGI21_000567 [Coemansia aciculifera]|nr:hypothetical protein GGI21_000567 [Coemansia aciculifera]
MSTYSPEAMAGVCAGVFGLAGVILATVVAMRRRGRLTNTLRNALEEEEDAEGYAAAVPVIVISNETQPLLSESAIRTRYASNPNEFARSYIDRPQHSSYKSPLSLVAPPSALPYSPAENVVIVAPSDISDSEDSGIESCLSTRSDEVDAIQLEAKAEDAEAAVVSNEEPRPSDQAVVAQDSAELPLSAATAPLGSTDNITVADVATTLVPMPFILSSETIASPEPSQLVPSKPLPSVDKLLAPHNSSATGREGRPRSSTLSARAQVFVPSGRSRTMVDTTSGSMGELKGSAAPISNAPFERSNAQMQALGHSTQSSTRSSLSESKTDVDMDKTSGEPQSPPVGTDTNEATEAAEAAEAESSTVFTPNRRCRFWPNCNNKNCKYSHPSRTCLKYPNCAYGEHCVFIHPSDAQRINDVISRGNTKRNKRNKKKRDLVRLNNIGDFTE